MGTAQNFRDHLLLVFMLACYGQVFAGEYRCYLLINANDCEFHSTGLAHYPQIDKAAEPTFVFSDMPPSVARRFLERLGMKEADAREANMITSDSLYHELLDPHSNASSVLLVRRDTHQPKMWCLLLELGSQIARINSYASSWNVEREIAIESPGFAKFSDIYVSPDHTVIIADRVLGEVHLLRDQQLVASIGPKSFSTASVLAMIDSASWQIYQENQAEIDANPGGKVSVKNYHWTDTALFLLLEIPRLVREKDSSISLYKHQAVCWLDTTLKMLDVKRINFRFDLNDGYSIRDDRVFIPHEGNQLIISIGRSGVRKKERYAMAMLSLDSMAYQHVGYHPNLRLHPNIAKLKTNYFFAQDRL